MNEDGCFTIIFWVALIGFGFYFFIGGQKAKDTHDVYTKHCGDINVTIDDCNSYINVIKTTYKAIPESQTVISKDLLIRRENCDVFDAKNWRCGALIMSSGRLIDTNLDLDNPKYKAISKIEYIYKTTQGFFGYINP